MNILVTINDNYMLPLLIMLESLFKNETEKMTIYLFYSDVSYRNRKRLNTYINKQGSKFVSLYVKEEIFNNAPVLRYFTKEMYYRFLCSSLLPQTVERVLYLDPDILIRSSIYDFYCSDFNGKQLIGIEDYTLNYITPDKKYAIGLTKDMTYINSGVLLFNLKKMRESFNINDFISILEKNRDKISFPDQDIMNLYFKNDIKLERRIYNYNTGYGSIVNMLKYFFGMKEKDEPVIVHYMGEYKPWHVDYFGKYFFEYYFYLKKHLSWRGKVLFAFKPCYVIAKSVKILYRRITNMFSGLYGKGGRVK